MVYCFKDDCKNERLKSGNGEYYQHCEYHFGKCDCGNDGKCDEDGNIHCEECAPPKDEYYVHCYGCENIREELTVGIVKCSIYKILHLYKHIENMVMLGRDYKCLDAKIIDIKKHFDFDDWE